MVRIADEYRDYAKGVKKNLSKSEIVRGYITASTNKKVSGILGKPVKIYVNDKFTFEKKYDRGRVMTGRKITQDIGSKPVTIKIMGDSIYINY